MKCIATDKRGYPQYFSYFSMKTYVVGTHLKHLAEVLLMSTHNICFRGEMRKISAFFRRKNNLSVAM